MKIFLATDHRGFELKEKIKQWLIDWSYQVEDLGALTAEPNDDYPDYVHKAAEAVATDPEARAIVLGATGQGEAMAANRHKGVRAAIYYGGPKDILKLSREHNNANVLSLGANFVDEETAKAMIQLWLETKFSEEERHIRRNNKLDA